VVVAVGSQASKVLIHLGTAAEHGEKSAAKKLEQTDSLTRNSLCRCHCENKVLTSYDQMLM
jgi:hypothetical protein